MSSQTTLYQSGTGLFFISKKATLSVAMTKKIHLSLGLLLLSTALAVGVFVTRPEQEVVAEERGQTKQLFPGRHRATLLEADWFETIFASAKTSAPAEGQVVSGVIPHHLVAAAQMADFFETIKGQKPPVVVVIGPNHLNRGRSPISTSEYAWKTSSGDIAPANEVRQKLLGKDIAIDENAVGQEWSVGAVVPFIKHTWPEATIVPLIIKSTATTSTLNEVALALSRTLPADSLVLASVDFSHYLPSFVADFHDMLAEDILASGSPLRLPKAEVDSPGSLYALLRYNELVGAKKWHLVAKSNSATIADKPEWLETTSHVLGYFTPGAPEGGNRVITMQFFGDIMIDRQVAKVMGGKGFSYLFAKLQGQEQRFFTGADLLMANLEGAFAPSRIATTKEIAFRFDPKWAKQLKSYGFGAVSLANNHTLDMGRANVVFTEKTLADAGIAYCGRQFTEGKDYNLVLGEAFGLPESVAFVCFEEVGRTADREKLAEALESAKKASRYVVVQVHSGIEYQRRASAGQQAMYRWLIDNGATIVVGHHPHVVQEIEIYKGKPIIYSLGNFVFDQYFSKDTQEGLSVGVVFKEGRVSALHLFPFFGVRSQVELMTGEKRKIFLEWMKKYSRLEGAVFEDGVITIN